MTTAQIPAKYDDKFETDSMTFYRVGRTVFVTDEHETMVDRYDSISTAQMIMEMARS